MKMKLYGAAEEYATEEVAVSPYTGQFYLFPVNGDVIDHEMETELFRAAEELMDSL